MNQTIKHVVISRNASHWQYGGAEQFSLNLAQALEKLGIQATIVSRVPELESQSRQAGISFFKNLWLRNRTQRRWLLVYYMLAPLLIAQYAWVLVRSRAQLLIAGSRDDQIFGTLACLLMGKPVIWIDHADMKANLRPQMKFLWRVYRWALGQAAGLIVVSEAEKAKIIPGLAAKIIPKITVINNGARLRKASSPLPHPAGRTVVAYAGRIEQAKGVFDLIAAAGQLKDLPLEFWLAGKGRDLDQAEQLVEAAGLSSQFKFIGHIDNIFDMLAGADLFVYPSHHDASPLAPVEALLAGLPVVASRVGGIPEVIDESCGRLVPPHSPAELASAIRSLATDPKLLKKLRTGAKLKGLSLELQRVVEQKYLPLIEKALKVRA